jgi:hypothetical protein
LRENKSKSDDTTTKARQYLDGLLKIPFGAFAREKILDEMATVKEIYSQMQIHSRNIFCEDVDDEEEKIEKTEKITVLEIKNSKRGGIEMDNKEIVKELEGDVSEIIEPKFRKHSELSTEQLTDPDYALKQLEKLNGSKLSITCSKCHHCK